MNYWATSGRALVLSIGLFGSAQTSIAGLRYRIEMIGQAPSTEPHRFVQSVSGLNNRGEVAYVYAGSIEVTPTNYRGVSDSYVATQAGVIAIPNLGYDDASARDLTDTGLVVGGAVSPDVFQRDRDTLHYYEAFVSKNGVTSVIPTSKRGYSYATAANNRGDVVGVASDGTAFLWNESSGYQNLGNFGSDNVEATDVNERGDVLIAYRDEEVRQYGESYFYQGHNSIIYNSGSTTLIPSSEFGYTYAESINDYGVVVGGFASIPGVETHAFVWDENRGFRDLGFAGEHGYAVDVNNSGVVIGAFADAYMAPMTPFVYTDQEGRQRLIDLIDDLNGFSWLESAWRINDRGQIAGIGETGGGWLSRRVFLATPIPEPSSFVIGILVVCCLLIESRHGGMIMPPASSTRGERGLPLN